MVNIPRINATTIKTFAYKPMQSFVERPNIIEFNMQGLKCANESALNKMGLQVDKINCIGERVIKKVSASEFSKISAEKVKSTLRPDFFEFDRDFEPKTLKKLFTDRYKSSRRFDENGNHVTTIIDKKTQEPVEVYIKNVEQEEAEESKKAVYRMYKNLPNGDERILGERSFGFDDENRCITPGYMESYANNEYEGIGTRLHQIAIEQAILKKYNKVELSSMEGSYIFHKKSLFNEVGALPGMQEITKEQQEKYINGLYKQLKEAGMEEKELSSVIKEETERLSLFYTTTFKEEELKRYFEQISEKFKNANMSIDETEFNSCLVFDKKSNRYNKFKIEENLRRLMCRKYGKITSLTTTLNMSLEGRNFDYWKTLAQQQHIFI